MPFDATPAREVPQAAPAETNPHPIYSLAGMIWWLERMPANGEYDWCSHDNCGACQYLKGRGEKAGVQQSAGREGQLNYSHLCRNADVVGIFKTQPWTFGAALKRARQPREGGQ